MVWLSYRLKKPSNTSHHIPLPKQLKVSGTHVVYSFSSNSYTRPVCLSSYNFILPRVRHDYAKPYVQAGSCYAGLDTLFSSHKDKCSAFCRLLCLGSSLVCWREMAHSHIYLNTQGKDCMVTCSMHTFQTQTHDWNTNETCWKSRGFKVITKWSSISYHWQSQSEDWQTR